MRIVSNIIIKIVTVLLRALLWTTAYSKMNMDFFYFFLQLGLQINFEPLVCNGSMLVQITHINL